MAQAVNEITAGLAVKKKRFGTMLVGIMGFWFTSFLFDYLLYPVVVWWFGILLGGAIMTLLSGLACYYIIHFYDRTKQDWLGIELVKEFISDNQHFLTRLLRGILRKGEVFVLCALSIKFDPTIATLYMRSQESQFKGFDRRTWIIFLSSVLIANAYWTFVAYTGVSLIKYGWVLVTGA